MENNNNIYKDLKGLAALLVIAVIAFLVGIAVNVATVQPDVTTDTIYEHYTDTVWQDREFYDTIPNCIYKYVTKVDTFYQKGDTVPIIFETASKTFSDTLYDGMDTLSYLAYVSGIEPVFLDSISFKYNKPVITNTINTTITAYEKPKKRFKDYISISPNISFGYGLVTNKIDTYAGVGIAIHL